jgi:hypothetical protein
VWLLTASCRMINLYLNSKKKVDKLIDILSYFKQTLYAYFAIHMIHGNIMEARSRR